MSKYHVQKSNNFEFVIHKNKRDKASFSRFYVTEFKLIINFEEFLNKPNNPRIKL